MVPPKSVTRRRNCASACMDDFRRFGLWAGDVVLSATAVSLVCSRCSVRGPLVFPHLRSSSCLTRSTLPGLQEPDGNLGLLLVLGRAKDVLRGTLADVQQCQKPFPAFPQGLDCGLEGTWQLLKRHGWSWQQPARRAIERDDEAVEVWKKETWPRVKAPRRSATPGFSSRTRPGSR
ncbi:helix-turn-helix domain-containing protein [Streptomyces canus]|uniref:helix-turn-helix domain-containing protein n=1 Tax=Streptomyces canus TaxID=58343 RepID=UPI003AF300E0